jgi:hypothetical protein
VLPVPIPSAELSQESARFRQRHTAHKQQLLEYSPTASALQLLSLTLVAHYCLPPLLLLLLLSHFAIRTQHEVPNPPTQLVLMLLLLLLLSPCSKWFSRMASL